MPEHSNRSGPNSPQVQISTWAHLPRPDTESWSLRAHLARYGSRARIDFVARLDGLSGQPHHLFNDGARVMDIVRCECGVYLEHETVLTELFGDRKALAFWPFARKCLLAVYLAAASDRTWNALRIDGLHDSITTPLRQQEFRANEDVVFVVSVS